jgi:4-diphosphocytidyl-2-C-methyl-D-erythritol kinase
MRIDRATRPQTGQAGWRITTPAKINLFLEVLGKRPDGYHDLDTVMLAIDLTDTLEIYPAESDQLSLEVDLSDAQVVSNQELAREDKAWEIPSHGSGLHGNLVLRALESLRQHLDSCAGASPRAQMRGAHVILKKRIPSQAGLGGGSSDAAAALVLGSLLWQDRYEPQVLGGLASRLGSDINFFLEGHNGLNWTARCTQRGQIVQPIENNLAIHGLIVHPPMGCSTAQVFSLVRQSIADRKQAQSPEALLECLINLPENPHSTARLSRLLYNRLGEAAVQTTEWVQRTAQRIDRYKPYSQCLSGSGSARFCLLPDRAQAETIAAQLQREGDFRAYPFTTWTSPSILDQTIQRTE